MTSSKVESKDSYGSRADRALETHLLQKQIKGWIGTIGSSSALWKFIRALVNVDIATYVRAILGCSNVPLEYQKVFREAIPGQAHGLFLYAKLAMDIFLKPGASAQEVLQALLKDMSVIYSNLLREHSRSLMEMEMADVIKVTHASLANQDLTLSKDSKGIDQALEMFVENNHWLRIWLEMRWEEGHGGVTPLHVAARYGLYRLFFWAAESGRKDIVKSLIDPLWTKLLLERSVDPNNADNKGYIPLHNPGNTDNMSQLIETDHADINAAIPSNGKTPLFFFLDRNATFLAHKSLDYGQDCKVVDREGNEELHVALGKSNSDARIIKKLIEAGTDDNLSNKSDITPMDVMRLSGEYAKEIWGMLLRAGADINAKDKYGRTALFRMERPRLDLFFGQGLDPQVVDGDGNTLLHEFSWHPSNFDNFTSVIPVWKQLLDLRLDPEKTNQKVRTPLQNLPCKAHRGWGEPDATYPMDLLLSRMKTIDAADEDGINPLHIVVTTSEYHAKELIDADANVKTSGLREACDLFGVEHALWNAPHRRALEPGNGDATGL
ncbi:ankyrin repeat domain-containing protein [Colletotrichum chrysophilum]|uniref:Ankyrin repeat domain-containing protein n=1 Tax=Colletotrichum chrysophilum TaxID=1836956 RepID=A0AAD9E6N0_9PEZI|nr:ankyrin repeat domain-containing protein [Colletotrichum chrysophilum]